MTQRRVALVHDWLTGMRGGEKVLLELCLLFPQAKLYTLLWNRGSVVPEIERQVAGVSFLQRLPGITRGYRNFLPLFPTAIRSLDVGQVDLVISTSHAVAKAVRVPEGAAHVSYIHTPMRYVWGDSTEYFRFGEGKVWKRAALSVIHPYLRSFDKHTAKGVDHFVANSRTVQKRILAAWDRDAEVIHPPVDTDYFCPSGNAPSEDYLVVSSLEPYKRIDLALEAFRDTNRRLLVAGRGTLESQLRRLAPNNVEFLGRVSDERLRELYQSCRALIFPGVEDFGMTPVEAHACGRPVVCFGRGGATESVIDSETGIHFLQHNAEGLRDALDRFEAGSWDPQRIRQRSLEFSRDVFRDKIGGLLEARLGFPRSQ
jgi:glycosyltransferase involved in cell wall biosynthesis